jgi:hypothetical protein
MRKVVVSLVAVAAVLLVAAAQASRHPTTTLAVSSLQVIQGDGVTLSGRISDRQAGMDVSILARPFNRGSMARIATVMTGNGGKWSFIAQPSIATTYAASIAGKTSRTIMVGVHPALTMTILSSGAVKAHVSAGRSFHGKAIELQRFTRSGGWKTFAKSTLGAASSTVFPLSSLPHGALLLRLAMSVNQAGLGYLGGFGSPVKYPAHGVSLQMSSFKVVYGNSLRLSGTVFPRHSGTQLKLLARPFMQAEFQEVATIHPSTAGKWQMRVKTPFTTSYQARFGNASSRVLTVAVRPEMQVRTLGGDRIWTHVSVSKSIAGRTIQIQRRSNGHWTTVARHALNAKASAIFTPRMLPAGTSTLRTAISVNQVGAGYLGGFGKPFGYHR